jgi:triosephosphate isomerase (TIM)
MTAPLVVGNWKMNGSQAECQKLARELARAIRRKATRVQVIVAPPFTALTTVARAIRHSKIKMAAQNCHWQESGAYTGEISAPMVAELGCEFVILGHSERRHILHESDEMIARKIESVMAHGMRAILCVGETLEERRQKLTGRVIARQLRSALKGSAKDVIDKLEIAYEPVWAIGTGQNATTAQVREVHIRIRRFLKTSFGKAVSERVRILYGGSVKPENADTVARIDEVDGLLVGGASLKAESFLPIVAAFTNK